MPELAPADSTEQVRQIVQCGRPWTRSVKFTAIGQNSVIHSVNNMISFSATPFVIVGPG